MEKIKIGDVCDILNGYAFKSENYVDSGIRIIRISNVQKGYIEDSTPAFYSFDTMGLSKFMLEEGDLLMSLTGNVGRVAILEKELLPAALNQRVACLRLKSNKITKSYLFHFLNSNFFEQQCIMASNGVAQKNMSTEWLKDYEIPLYTPNQQEEIVTVLNAAQSILSSRRQQLQKLDELVKARFVEMFGDVICNSKSWEIRVLADIASSRLGKMLDTKQQTGECSYPYLANFNVQWFRFNTENLNQMDFNEEDRIEFELQNGDLLVCEGGEIGRCAVWHNEIQPCFFQKALHRVRCNRQIVHPDYLGWWFKYNCDHDGFATIAGAKATIAHLPGVKLKQLRVAIPPLELQEQFAAFVEQTDKSKVAVQKALDEAQLLFDSLMQKYFGDGN